MLGRTSSIWSSNISSLINPDMVLVISKWSHWYVDLALKMIKHLRIVSKVTIIMMMMPNVWNESWMTKDVDFEFFAFLGKFVPQTFSD